jgi:hypothetical protein
MTILSDYPILSVTLSYFFYSFLGIISYNFFSLALITNFLEGFFSNLIGYFCTIGGSMGMGKGLIGFNSPF